MTLNYPLVNSVVESVAPVKPVKTEQFEIRWKYKE